MTSIYNPDIVPLEYRQVVIDTYVDALRVVFLVTLGFVLLNFLSGMMLEEHTLHDNLERTTDNFDSQSEITVEGA